VSTSEVVWYGPRSLTQVRQVCIPVDLVRALGLDVGSEIQFALAEDGDEIRIRPTGRTKNALESEGSET
jgi:antitoxin component of MazEF toxin-antitoxin module